MTAASCPYRGPDLGRTLDLSYSKSVVLQHPTDVGILSPLEKHEIELSSYCKMDVDIHPKRIPLKNVQGQKAFKESEVLNKRNSDDITAPSMVL